MEVEETVSPMYKWWPWKASRRRKDMDDPLFEAGDIVCSKRYTKICVDEEDDYKDEPSR